MWKLRSTKLIAQIRFPAPISFFKVFGSLVAVALDDGSVAVCDLISHRIVRHFQHIGSSFTDVAFRADGRWLAVATVNAKLHIYDLPSARCIDILKFRSPVLALAFSPNNAYLLTSHPRSAPRGAVHVWANKYLFDPSLNAPLLRGQARETDMEPKQSNGVSSSKALRKLRRKMQGKGVLTGESGDGFGDDFEGGVLSEDEDDFSDDDDDDGDETCMSEAPDAAELQLKSSSIATPLEEGMVTLSSHPHTQWENILHLEEIKERNKPKGPEKAKSKAPFFLPTTFEGSESKFMNFDGQGGENNSSADGNSGTKLKERGAIKNKGVVGAAGLPELPRELQEMQDSAVDFFTNSSGSSSSSGNTNQPKSRIFSTSGDANTSSFSEDTFLSPLQRELRKKDYDGMLEVLLKQTASGVHLAISELGPLAGGSVAELNGMLDFFDYHFKKAHHADLLQTYLALFLNKHSADLLGPEGDREKLGKLMCSQKNVWGKLDAQFHKCICFLKILTQTQSQW
jgi:U3 small nucleolar RNA-associated protein 21